MNNLRFDNYNDDVSYLIPVNVPYVIFAKKTRQNIRDDVYIVYMTDVRTDSTKRR